MKLAIATDDGQTISAHFGRASAYLVVTLQEGQVVERELREKANHNHFQHDHSHDQAHEHHHPEGHGFDAAAQDRHAQMLAAITDCQAVLARGMGRGMYISLQQANLEPILTSVAQIDEAVTLYLAGRLQNHPERLH